MSSRKSSGGGGKGKAPPAKMPGQSSLFTFFTKAPSSAASTDSGGGGGAAAPSRAAADSKPAPKDSFKSPPPSKSSAAATKTPSAGGATRTPSNSGGGSGGLKAPSSISPADSKLASDPRAAEAPSKSDSGKALACATPGGDLVGKAIEVWWPDEKCWNGGVVAAFDAASGKHTVDYAGGDTERVLLDKERWRPQQQQQPTPLAASAPKREAPATGSSGGSSARKRARRLDDSEEEWDQDEVASMRAAPEAATPAAKAAAPKRRAVIADDSEGDDDDWVVDDADEVEAEEDDEEDFDAESGDDGEEKAAAATRKRKGKDGGGGKAGKPGKRLRKGGAYAITETKTPSAAAKKKPAAKAQATASAPRANGKAPSASKSPPSTNGKSAAAATPDAAAAVAVEGGDASPAGRPRIELPEGVINTGGHLHHKMDFLKEGNRMDANRRKPDHPEYSPRTLYVPPGFKTKETAAMQQWWDLKSQNMDTVLFFKVGKFYELFHMDADGEKAHSGFPEISYGKFADTLVERGYRVARVEQTETPDMMKERNKTKAGPKDKVVKRELCSVLSRGTRTYCFLDSLSRAPDGAPGTAAPLLAIVERQLPQTSTPPAPMEVDGDEAAAEDEAGAADAAPAAVCEYGICLVDAATATFRLGQFADTAARPRLRTLLAQAPPAEASLVARANLIFARNSLSETTTHLLKCMVPNALLTQLIPGADYWGPEKTRKEITAAGYFKPNADTKGGEEHWPELLRAVVAGGADAELCLAAAGAAVAHLRRSLIDHDLAEPCLAAAGAAAAHLRRLLIDHDLVRDAPLTARLRSVKTATVPCPFTWLTSSMSDARDPLCRFEAYIPPDETLGDDRGDDSAAQQEGGGWQAAAQAAQQQGQKNMVLDGVALANLDVFRNSYDGSERGTLWSLPHAPPHTRSAAAAAAAAGPAAARSYDGSERGTLWSLVNRCSTPFGRRLLREWLCRPLLSADAIGLRLDAVEDLITALSPEADALRRKLKGLPDIERLLSRVHSMASLHRATRHPDSRAVMYELDRYGRRKIGDFCYVLDGLEAAAAVPALLREGGGDGPSAELLRRYLLLELLRRYLLLEVGAAAYSSRSIEADGGSFPDMADAIAWFRGAFDAEEAKKARTIKPRAGVDEAYDAAKRDIARIEGELEAHLQQIRKELRCSTAKWVHAAKERFQVELPENMAVPREFDLRSKRKLPEITAVLREFDLRSKRKGFRRFWTPYIARKLGELAEADAALEDGQRISVKNDAMRRLFAKFDAHRDLWAQAVTCLAHVDALLALAAVSGSPGYCRPAFREGAEPFMRLQQARHPCIAQTYQARHPCMAQTFQQAGRPSVAQTFQGAVGRCICNAARRPVHAADREAAAHMCDGIAPPVGVEFIPNDTALGPDPSAAAAGDSSEAHRLLMLSGPNMGGKSTLLRQTCLVAIMAQSAELTPVDRIFTRVGASDRILAGQSTFFVELSETAAILHHATPRSLVILDELGRGTSTFDGTAIAHAVVSLVILDELGRGTSTFDGTAIAHAVVSGTSAFDGTAMPWSGEAFLVNKARCLSLFATHYHSLVEDWGTHPQVKNAHMGCIVDGEGEAQRVTFLYTLTDGACPKSFGINVARLARLPHQVLVTAERKSHAFEAALQQQQAQHRASAGSADAAASDVASKLLALLEAAESDPATAGESIKALWVQACGGAKSGSDGGSGSGEAADSMPIS
ncbi:muts protein 6 [Tribonema minus]|uniref:DNA mismatch repair protein n=1 Tax=Tribonema minus TaxID=303371 RepID=A0A835YGI1_9STRA|nr:muts protein 6 [Tribonema minus]